MSHETNDGLRSVEALRYDGESRSVREDHVIEETPIALLYNGLSFAVMMATPTDLEDFALGFALCEGVVESAGEFRLVDIAHHPQGIALHAAIPQTRFDALETRQRSLEGRSGCGLCGISSLDAALRPPRRVGKGPKIAASEIHASLARLTQRQSLNSASGGAHAAGFFTSTLLTDHRSATDSLLVREDVGRHNAVDKLVGAMLRAASPPPSTGFLVVTSRASYEIVHKSANAGIAMIVAMSAPTALAIRHAEDAGITLIAFARDGRMNVYSGDERIA